MIVFKRRTTKNARKHKRPCIRWIEKPEYSKSARIRFIEDPLTSFLKKRRIKLLRRQGRRVPPRKKKQDDLQEMFGADLNVSEAEVRKELCKASFYHFVKEYWSTVIPEKPDWNWHIAYLCHELQKMAEDVFANRPKKYDLVVNISPGTTKSTITSVMLPAWIWTRMPSARTICVSYSTPLALDLSRRCRDVIQSDKYKEMFPEIKIRDDQNAKSHYANKNGGYRYCAGVDGAVTGMHAHFIIIDDPLNPQEAVSDVLLESANRWVKETLSSRKVNKAVTPEILIMQRLHEYDPTAIFLEKKRIRHICLPAELTDDVKPYGLRKFYKNGLMDPNRLGHDVLQEAMQLGTYYYAGQYLQNPVPPGGGMFKVENIRTVTSTPPMLRKVRYWDKAGTAGGGAYTAGVLMGITEDRKVYILDVIRVQLDSWEREKLIRLTAEVDGRDVIIGLEQEPNSGGKESAANSVRNLLGFRIRIDKTGPSEGDKVNRADPLSAAVNAGIVHVVEAPWNKVFLEELKHFPNSRYKDQTDAAAHAYNAVAKLPRRIGGIRKTGTGAGSFKYHFTSSAV